MRIIEVTAVVNGVFLYVILQVGERRQSEGTTVRVGKIAAKFLVGMSR